MDHIIPFPIVGMTRIQPSVRAPTLAARNRGVLLYCVVVDSDDAWSLVVQDVKAMVNQQKTLSFYVEIIWNKTWDIISNKIWDIMGIINLSFKQKSSWVFRQQK